MSVLYSDLSLTAFPGDIDSFTTWLDIIASDGALVLQYHQAMQAGNTVLANQILAQIPSATQKIIKATDLNKMTQAILAVERFYKTDVEPYIQEQQANWLEIIQRFSYKGEWASGTTYEVNNFVSYTVSGATLIYLATSNPPVGTPPTNTNYWRLLSIQGQQGPSGEGVSYRQEWNSSTQYYTDDTVTYGGALWIATQNSQGQTPQSGSQYWQLVMSLGLTTYPIQDSEPTGQEVGGLWFNTQVNPTNYYQLATLENPATAAQISAGYEAYNDDGEVITGTQSMDDYLRTDGTNAMTGILQANAGILVDSTSSTPTIQTNTGDSLQIVSGTTPVLTLGASDAGPETSNLAITTQTDRILIGSEKSITLNVASGSNTLSLAVGGTNRANITSRSISMSTPLYIPTTVNISQSTSSDELNQVPTLESLICYVFPATSSSSPYFIITPNSIMYIMKLSGDTLTFADINTNTVQSLPKIIALYLNSLGGSITLNYKNYEHNDTITLTATMKNWDVIDFNLTCATGNVTECVYYLESWSR